MDVNTVVKRLKNNRYPTVESLYGDLLLVYDNAIRYYQQGGAHKNILIYEAAKVVLRLARCDLPAQPKKMCLLFWGRRAHTPLHRGVG